ncbi:hypothetical protein [Pseudoduganella armeniaca]|uniref:Uncharacterized protein n=1 Tax=Pseudoduganella armeniaca TaxID=2072590 RepID=A0A2R4CAW4_9BURK|nr:hypothetical protein [Pseudoduganella armeniaca]AVR96741.1 hypothetical protein C9I28_14450 [Pseudoduganella armeniaca]
MDRRLIDYKPEMEFAPLASATHDEAGEMSYAAQLLEARSPALLDSVLRDLLARARIAGPVAQPIAATLRRAARLVFPLNGTRAPGDLKRKAAAIFGMELEGLSPEDKEFELARRFVRLAGDVIDEARARAGQAPERAARLALQQAARRYAPGLLRQDAQAAATLPGRRPRQRDRMNRNNEEGGASPPADWQQTAFF